MSECQPIVVFSVDEGPDENPQKVIVVVIQNFVKHKPGCSFCYRTTNAPSRGAFNRIKRRIAPLSRELSGLIQSHEHFGSHLDSQGRTNDGALEKDNYRMAGETLVEVWSQVVIDQFPPLQNILFPENELDPESLIAEDTNWFQQHIKTSQYLHFREEEKVATS
jgi:hypothetical protein